MSERVHGPVLGIVLSLALVACQSAAETAPAAPTAATTPRAQAPDPAAVPQPWPTQRVLAIGEEVALGDGRLKLLRIAADSRCPKDAQCIWAGEVTLAFAFTGAGGARTFQLSERGNPRTSLGSHDIALTGFGACPAGHTPPSPTGCASVAFSPAQLR
jgi:hypothetical protein